MLKLKQKRWIFLIISVLSLALLADGNAQATDLLVAQVNPSTASETEATFPESQPISEAQRSLIYQLLELTGGRQRHEQMQQIMFAQLQEQVPLMLEQVLGNTGSLSPTEEDAAINAINQDINQLILEFSEAIQAEVTYEETLEQIYYPLYAQYFTEADLQSLIDFYQTPIGEKLIAVSPQLYQTSLELSNEVFMPRMIEILSRIIQNRVDQMQDTSIE